MDGFVQAAETCGVASSPQTIHEVDPPPRHSRDHEEKRTEPYIDPSRIIEVADDNAAEDEEDIAEGGAAAAEGRGLAGAVTQCLDAWREVDLETSREQLDAEVLALAERKEEYVMRRKALSGKVKEFTISYINGVKEISSIDELRVACKQIIGNFKTEYDHIASMLKSTEAAFLHVYHLIRDAPDPYPILDEVVSMQLQYQQEVDGIKEELVAARAFASIAEQKLNDDNHLAELKVEMKESMEAQVREEKLQFEEDFRRRESNMRKQYESRDHDVQQSFQRMMADKDAEVAQLVSALQQARENMNEYMERDSLLSAQEKKLETVEDKLTAMAGELNEKSAHIVTLQDKLTHVTEQLHAKDISAAAELKIFAAKLDAGERQRLGMQKKVAQIEQELQQRPPADLSALSVALGIPLWQNTDVVSDESVVQESEERAADTGRGVTVASMRWSHAEEQIVKAVRASAAAAADCRSREVEALQTIRENSRTINELTEKLGKREEAVVSLERDLQSAQNALQSTRGSKFISLTDVSLQGISASNRSGGDSEYMKLTSADVEDGLGASLMQTMQGQRDRLGKLAHEHEKEAILLRATLQRSREELKDAQAENVELFKRLRTARAASAVRQSAAGGSNGQSVQPSMGMDSRGNAIKPRSSRKKAGLTWNYGDSGGNGEQESIQTAPPPFGILASQSSAGGKYGEGAADIDALEGKYMQLYEAQLDPFKIEEVDRQIIMSRLNVLDWSLANIARILLKDQWTRYALMLYILLVHIFASGYVIQVLNPEIMSEIDGGSRDASSSVIVSPAAEFT